MFLTVRRAAALAALTASALALLASTSTRAQGGKFPLKDANPEPMDVKKLQEMSQKTIDTGHPAVFMLFPNSKAAAAPQLVMMEGKYWVVNGRAGVTAAGKKGTLGIGLTVVGTAE